MRVKLQLLSNGHVGEMEFELPVEVEDLRTLSFAGRHFARVPVLPDHPSYLGVYHEVYG